MFDRTYVSHPKVTSNISIQACSGGIYKSHPKSRIVNMHITSELAKEMLTASSRCSPTANGKKIVVLQVINAVEGYVLVEYMYKEDYEAENVYFNPDGSNRVNE